MEYEIDRFSGRYRFLSNFWRCVVAYDGLAYPSSEHAFQAAKTTNRVQRVAIQTIPSPGQAKKFGRGMSLRVDWESIKLDVMQTVVSDKFSRNSELKERLLETGDRKLIEGNTWNDTYWGVCNGVGENHLGTILMQVREAVRL